MKTLIACTTLLALLAAAAALAYLGWTKVADVEMSTHGVIALILGVVVTVGLGAGLMALLFYSSRRGHDDIDMADSSWNGDSWDDTPNGTPNGNGRDGRT